MGDWHISIHGMGCHDNGESFDAEALAKDFLATLRAHGHVIKSAYVNIGGHVPQSAGVTYVSGHTHDLLEVKHLVGTDDDDDSGSIDLMDSDPPGAPTPIPETDPEEESPAEPVPEPAPPEEPAEPAPASEPPA